MEEPKKVYKVLGSVIKDKDGKSGGALFVCTNKILEDVYNINIESDFSNYSSRGFANSIEHYGMIDRDFVAITESTPGKVKIVIDDDDQNLLSEIELEQQENSIKFLISRSINREETFGDKRIISGIIQGGAVNARVSEKGKQDEAVESFQGIRNLLTEPKMEKTSIL